MMDMTPLALIKEKKPLFYKEKLTRPTISDTYAWCDFIELKCLLSEDGRFSRGQLLELLDDSAQFNGEKTDSDDRLLNSEIPSSIEDEDEEEDDEGEEAAPVTRQSIRNDLRVNAWFNNICFREYIFEAEYPFFLSEDKKEIFVKKSLNNEQKFYLQLLISSCLRLVPKERWPDLTEPFEIISAEVFTALMPKGWSVHRFGAKGSTKYTGTLYNKLTNLAKDIRAIFSAPPHYYKPGNSGDGGLDLVAWHPLGDERTGIPVALAQCGCVADEWTMKTLEASPARLGANLRPPLPWMTYYFMPHDLVFNSGQTIDWQRGSELTGSIVIDRLRFTKLAKMYDLVGQDDLMHPTVEEVLKLKIA